VLDLSSDAQQEDRVVAAVELRRRNLGFDLRGADRQTRRRCLPANRARLFECGPEMATY
jgi:hypothetical protein